MHVKEVIGSNILIDVANYKNIPAKVDTGADSSAIWATDINITKDNILEFKLFDKNSPFYTGELLTSKRFKALIVRSSHGDEQIRYRTTLPTVINGRKIKVLFNLADRSKNHFPVLIGKRTIRGKFIVDVSQKAVKPTKKLKSNRLNKELHENPYKFHQKYLRSNKKGATK
jgi:hypothetical protein